MVKLLTCKKLIFRGFPRAVSQTVLIQAKKNYKVEITMCVCVCVCAHTCMRMCICVLCHVRLFATPSTVACQTPLLMGFFQAIIHEWVVISSSRGSSDPGVELVSPALTGRFCTTEPPGKPENSNGEDFLKTQILHSW